MQQMADPARRKCRGSSTGVFGRMDRSLGTEAGVEKNGRAERLDEGPDTSDPAFRSRIKDVSSPDGTSG